MSGGHFDWVHFRIEDAADEIEKIVKENPDAYPPEVLRRLNEAACISRKTALYLKEVDLLLENDTGPDTFLQSLDLLLGPRI